MQGIDNKSFEHGSESRGSVTILGYKPSNADGETPSLAVYQHAATQVAAVSIRNGEKSFRGKNGQKVPVLNGYNMTVTRGFIYSLLGSSGCGKTTVLKSIVGVQQLDGGFVKVFGETPGSDKCGIPGSLVGYMPQDAALYDDFTIAEMLSYFGKIYNMTRKAIKERSEFLVDLLKLPDSKQKIGSLSGGQQRRTSFAAALIHSPSILILDEPTVGVDPLLRQSIWKYLRQLATECKTTVLITTHYIEETRQSDVIGVMRNGRLLTEKHPLALLEEFNQEFLEDVVLHMCHSDDDTASKIEEISKSISDATFPGVSYSEMSERNRDDGKAEKVQDNTSGLGASLRRIQAMASKTATIYTRNLVFLAFAVVFPISQIFTVAITIGSNPVDPSFGIVNFDSVAENCSHFPPIRQPFPGSEKCGQQDLSCRFLSKINQNEISLINYRTMDEALEAVEQGSTWGFMTFPQNFSSAFYRLQQLNEVENSTDGIFKFSHMIHFRMDMSNKLVSQFFQQNFLQAYGDFLKEYKVGCGYDKRTGEFPLKVEEPIFGQNDDDFSDYILVSTLSLTLVFFPMFASSFWFIFDKRNGTQSRTMVAGVKSWEIMLGSGVIDSIIVICQIVGSFVAIRIMCGVIIAGSPIFAFAFSFLVGVCGISMGFLLGTLCSEEIHVGIAGLSFFLPSFIVSGVIWSTESMHIVLQYFVMLLPATLPAEALRSIVTRGAGPLHYRVWPAIFQMLCYTTICWLFIILVYRHRSGRKLGLGLNLRKASKKYSSNQNQQEQNLGVKYSQRVAPELYIASHGAISH